MSLFERTAPTKKETSATRPAGLSTGLVALVSFFVGAVLSNKLMDPRKRGRVELP